MRTVGEAHDDLQRVAHDWVLWAHRLEDAILANPVECHCWDLDRKPFRNAAQGHTGACEEWRQIATAIRTKPKMIAGPATTSTPPAQDVGASGGSMQKTHRTPSSGEG